MQVITNDTTLAGFFPATAMPNPDWWQALWPQPQQVLAALGVRPDMEVVDLCCGDGLFTAPLALMVRRVIAIDIDPGMLTLARAKVAAVGATNCDLIEGDAYAVAELLRGQVDFVLIANTFHGVPDKPRLARSVAAILKPRWALCGCQLAPSPARGNDCPWTAARAEDRDADDAIGRGDRGGTRQPKARQYH